jgi:hypothetical protein
MARSTLTAFAAVAAIVTLARAEQAGSPPSAPKRELDTAQIEQITGLKGALNKDENVFKVSQPRTDVHVTIDGRAMEPFMGLTSWASFTSGKASAAMVMGDLVLFQDEVNPVMSAALDSGLAVTGLHNHFFYDEPRVFFMHVGGEGTLEQLAGGVRKALDTVKTIRAANAQPAARFDDRQIASVNSITAATLDQILGVKGQSKDGMYKAVIGATVRMPCGCEVGKEMGVNTWAAFAGTDDAALVDGDFVTFEGELQPVLKALRSGGINIVAIHNHMEGESPKAVFLHYWGKGNAMELAKGVKAALDSQAHSTKSADAKGISDSSTRFTFDDAPIGGLPDGWRVGTTKKDGPHATWKVVADEKMTLGSAGGGNQVLSLIAPNHRSSASYNICWTNRLQFQDGVIELKVRANSGKDDQGGGPIWRAIDADNYYIARYNPLENNFRVYSVKDGKRTQLASAEDIAISSGEWFTIRASHVGNSIECWLNGKKLLQAEDATLPGAGGVGVWTKADAATSFDDLAVSSAP